MNLIDSSAWIEYFSGGENVAFFSSAFQEEEKILVSSINLYEVFKVFLRTYGEHEALKAVALMKQGQVVEVTESIALSAANISHTQKLGFADSILLATARHYNATLWTQDSDFKDMEGVQYIAKKYP